MAESRENKYDQHFRLDLEGAVAYTREVLDFFSKDAKLKGEEIGDGNINYVFRVWEEGGEEKRSIILKQGDSLLRSSGRPLDIRRTEIEAKALMGYDKRSIGLSPRVYQFDPVMSLIAMEDLYDHENLRKGLLAAKVYPQLSEDITTFIARNTLLTSDLAMDPKEKKKSQREFVNPDMCDITEDLVFTEPFTDYKGRNVVLPENMEFVERELYKDRDLHLEAGKLKEIFMNRGEALIHGDLHTGSIFVTEESTRVLDAEFAFYGPIAYDLGNFLGNLFFPMAYHRLVNLEEEKNLTREMDFLVWLEQTIVAVVDRFVHKWKRLYESRVTDSLYKQEAYRDWYLDRILGESMAMAGLEIIRRIVGDAKVEDIENIKDLEKRVKVERVLILTGKEFVKEGKSFKDGRDLIEGFEKAIYDTEKMEENADDTN
ncbi:S-methyl-5-thioribose kinase [Isachenkonia alkalipeptolytica]|uniref:S-methyl-5-thioribose kinase n=1 Tax=Isachenkonia alkalipeptolytica TaxID=2565777 RepID=A0AA43XKH0_9CLOT|nr:S-methyl-5-thioribose kinase [Isachenkonia alkalipeptolytica]NBG88367.1 S-methyl-5-thioribose kinase [Isachenkonia alkalipeptolytica]